MYDSLYYRYINIHYIRYKGSVYANILTMLLEDRLVANKEKINKEYSMSNYLYTCKKQ